ncbi:DUF3617 family protein [Sphingopyxis sp. Geo48]|uniref:DUF3617 domain-containing protein n=1 Tax=Sphingopyxis sp. Geo48 TaxID=545241 RepID=UPI0024B7AAB9|nr:DUF3617 family protein [Sphingopyxis sp. Geo48]
MSASACASRDAANEEAVDLTPGEYHVTLAGGGLGQLAAFGKSDGPGGVDDRICVSGGDAAHFHEALVRKYLSFGDNCSLEPTERKGNAVGGSLTCATDQQRMPGSSFVVDYNGALSPDAIEMKSNIKVELSASGLANMDPGVAAQMKNMEEMIEKLDIRLTAKRLGDCS